MISLLLKVFSTEYSQMVTQKKVDGHPTELNFGEQAGTAYFL